MSEITNRCPNCERALTGEHNFCPFCGHDMRAPTTPPVAPLTSESEQSRAPAPPPANEAPAPATRRRAKGGAKPARRGFRLFDWRVLFGLAGLVELPLLILLAFLFLRPAVLEPAPSLACDELNPELFEAARFERGLGGELEEDTLFRTGTEYLIQDTLVVPQGIRLLIQPGAHLEFEDGAGLEVRGALYGCGSEQEPLTFTSPEGEPGSWTGIYFIDAAADSALTHALIQFAGDRAVNLENSAPAFYDVKIASSNAFPLSSDGKKLPETMVDVVLENNPFDGIEIRPGAKDDRQNITWPNHGFVYVLSGLVEIGENTTLEIEPGTMVKFWQADRELPALRIRGLLKAEEVNFTSVYDSREEVGGVTYIEARDPAPGDWGGITFANASSDSYLRRVLVQYAGNEQGAVVFVETSPELTEVTIADSAWYPLSAAGDSFPTLEALTLRDNEPGDALEIRPDSAIGDRQAYTWEVLGGEEQIVRVIRGEVQIGPEATLTIEPGVVIKFQPDGRLRVQGTLQAVGGDNEGEKIVFTSLRDADYGGDTDKNTGPQDEREWQGIVFDGADDSSIIENTIVRYGFIAFTNGASPRIVGNEIRDSGTAALWSGPGASPILSDNHLQDNAVNGMNITGGEVGEDQVWSPDGAADGPMVRVLTDRVTIVDGFTLRLEPGTIVKADEDGWLRVNGDLIVDGTESEPVLFTSLYDDSAGGDTNEQLRQARAGDWPGLSVAPNASLSLAYTAIRYAATGLRLEGGNEPTMNGWVRITDGVNAIWCDGRMEIPDTLTANNNEDNYRQCPTE